MIKQIIKGYYQWFKYQFNKEYREKMQKEAERRIKICESCKFFWKPARNCIICGCLMDVKTKMDFELDDEGISIDGCAERKW